ncbi:hypothetical protein [Paractinoplanes maris]|uniref:hypothetical protein n=1 Tax=Paractinoplanes maris TaxID=1734446 RepID=UPI0020224CE4|nr:hypothetical protein [Actinoplanes maris]
MVNAGGHAYPWDVLDDPDFPARVRRAGLDTVTLAATYHSTRAATPLHPARRTVDARHAALYRPIRDQAWAGQRLWAAAADWMAEPDPFGAATQVLRDNGFRVTAWIVLTHSTRIGAVHQDVAVVNCFGELYPYALCPASPEVRRYAATLAAEAVRDAPVDAVSLEACGQMGVDHLGHHEKTAGAWTAHGRRVLSVCCCGWCRAAWRQAGVDDAEVVGGLRAERIHDVVLPVRQAHTDALRTEVIAAVRAVLPDAPIRLHASPDPWATGPSPGLTPTAAADVDALLVPAWPLDSAPVVAAATAYGTPVDAYVTVLSDVEPFDLVRHAKALVGAGAAGLSLYHLGLAPAWRQGLFADILGALR